LVKTVSRKVVKVYDPAGKGPVAFPDEFDEADGSGLELLYRI